MPSSLKTRPWRLLFAFALLLAGCLHTAPGQAGNGEKVRVLILKSPDPFELKGTDRGDLRVQMSGQDSALVNGRPGRLPMRLYPDGEFIYVNGRPYRGMVEVSGAGDALLAVNEIDIETYIAGIINNEISSKWAEDVIKAQAVIARTYALFIKLKRREMPYHLESSVMGQVYGGASSEDAASIKAVRDTNGEILVFDGEPALTVYHSNAGGFTDSASDIWRRDYPYLVPVESPFDSTAPRFRWEFAVPAEFVRAILVSAGHHTGEPLDAAVVETTRAGRVKLIAFRDGKGNEARVSGEDLRKAVGYSVLRSTFFEVEKDGKTFVFKGKGSGHGVGLSQWGAKGMAENGYSYREILKHFYPGTELTRAW